MANNFAKFMMDANFAKLNESVRNNPNYVKKPVFSYGAYAIHRAIEITPEEKAVEIISWLINHGADPNVMNAKNETPLRLAIKLKKYTIAKCLLENGASPNKLQGIRSPLYEAISTNDIKFVQLLLAHNVDVHENFPLHYAIDLKEKNAEIIRLLLENDLADDINKVNEQRQTPYSILYFLNMNDFKYKFEALMTPHVIEKLQWNTFFGREFFGKLIRWGYLNEACYLAELIPIETFDRYVDDHFDAERVGYSINHPSSVTLIKGKLNEIQQLYSRETNDDKKEELKQTQIKPIIKLLEIMKTRGVDIESLSEHPFRYAFTEFNALFQSDEFSEARNIEYVSPNSENIMIEPIENGNEIAILDNQRRNQRVVIRKANGTITPGRLYLVQTKKNPLTRQNLNIRSVNVRTARIRGGRRLRRKTLKSRRKRV